MEEPEILLKQAIREMEEELIRDQQSAKLIETELKQLRSRQNELEQRLKETNEELDLCFDNGNESLSRVLLKRKLESERFLQYLAHKQAEQQEKGQAIRQRIAENRSRLESMRQKAELLFNAENQETGNDSWSEPDFMRRFTVDDNDIELALLREKQRRSQS